MTQHPKKNNMLKMPAYPGGKKAFQEFIAKNFRYPKEAEDANIEGSVIVGYEITDNGMVQNPHIIKGLGYGCDEEAIRLIRLLRYEKVRNKRVRLKLTTRITIHFNLQKLSISYSVTETGKQEKPEAGSEPKNSSTSYSYTIDLSS
ncbi:MAG: energy transducer TonB [Porphyromonadaceae bacterium]|nr:MAG: energy transducer TonB [Porphyromonadaceae bacterium]